MEQSKITISTAYFPPIDHFAALANGTAVVERHENFQKHSVRNRARIMTATGVQTLSVPVVGGRGVRLPITQVEVDYSTNFQREHKRAITTAYRSAPYFEHFWDKIEPLLETKERFLIDFNTYITQQLLKILKQPASLETTTEFCGAVTPPTFSDTPYFQVFGDRQPFIPNLSIMDWIFCNGFLRT